jgi:hypothetical protein
MIFFMLNYYVMIVCYALERFRVKWYLHASRREINKITELYWKHVAKKYYSGGNIDDFLHVELLCNDQVFFEILKMKIRSVSITYSIRKSRDEKEKTLKLIAWNYFGILHERKNIFWDKKVINSALFNKRGLTPCEPFIHRITRHVLEIHYLNTIQVEILMIFFMLNYYVMIRCFLKYWKWKSEVK